MAGAGVSNGQLANETTFDGAFIPRNGDGNTIGKLDLQNTATASGTDIINLQRNINSIASALGISTNQAKDLVITWLSSFIGAATSDVVDRIEALTALFNSTGDGKHAHDNTDGGGPAISALSLSNFNPYRAAYQQFTKAAASGSSTVITTQMSGKAPSGGDTVVGVVTDAPRNKCHIVNNSTGVYLEDAQGQVVYGRITYSAGVWTISYYTNEAGTETATSISSTDITAIFIEVFTVANLPTIPSNPADFGTLDVTANVVDASISLRGLMNTVAQSFLGVKTFTDTTDSTSTTTGSIVSSGGIAAAKNITSGAVIQAVTDFLANFGGNDASANGKGLRVQRTTDNGQVLFDSTLTSKWKAGTVAAMSEVIVAALTQTITGDKTLSGTTTLSGVAAITGVLNYDINADSTTTGSNQSLTSAKVVQVLTNASLTSINNVASPTKAKVVVIVNQTSGALSIINNSGGTASNRIVSPTGANMSIPNNGSVTLVYDDASARWYVTAYAQAASGTVTSVALSLPAEFSVTGSPVTSSGTLTAAWASQAEGLFLASNKPGGGSGTPAFRKPFYSDIPIDSSNEISNLTLAGSVASNALTIAVKTKAGTDATASDACRLGVYDTSGGYSQKTITGALSITAPNGATLGTKSGFYYWIFVYAYQFSGSFELALSLARVNTAIPQNTTVMNASSDNNYGIYSTTARSNVSLIFLGAIRITEATAGVWATGINITALNPCQMSMPALSAIRSTTQSIPTSTDTVIIYDTSYEDNRGGLDTSTGRYRVSEGGNYFMAASLFLTSGVWTVGNNLTIRFVQRNSAGTVISDFYIYERQVEAAATEEMATLGSKAMICSAGDTLEVLITQSSGTTKTTIAGINHLAIFKFGDPIF